MESDRPASLADMVASFNTMPRPGQVADPRTIGMAWTYGNKPPVDDSAELRRILALPRRRPPTPGSVEAEALIELMTARYGRPNPACQCRELAPMRPDPCIKRLRLVQAWTLYELGLHGGVLGGIGVGHGKTLLDLLAPLAIPGCQLAVLLIKPKDIDQLVDDYQMISEHFRVPSLIVHRAKPGDYVAAVPGAPTLHVMSYSRLQHTGATVFFETLQPDTIIGDEVDCLRKPDSVRTHRVTRWFQRHPETRFAGWTGSLTDSSPRDYAHLACLALREGSPVPIDGEVVEDWCRALDPVEEPAPAGALMELCAPGEGLYDGFHRRLAETPGIILTTEASVSVELSIDERPVHAVPQAIRDALRHLRKEWERPDGELTASPLDVARWACELACGFHYQWIYPRGEPRALIDEWFAARRAWSKELRTRLMNREPYLDSPKYGELAAMRAHGDLPLRPDRPTWKSETWPRWRDVRDKVKPRTRPVRIHPFLAEDAARWAHEHRGIVWYEHADFGLWVSQVADLPLHGGGPGSRERIKDEKGDRSIVASRASHGRGLDGLQFLFQEQLVASPPTKAADWEQLLGRLHRPGQEHAVRAWFYRHTPELEAHVDTALRRAFYVEGTLRQDQKLRLGWTAGISALAGTFDLEHEED